MKKGIIYTRVSPRRDLKLSKSIPTQIAICREVAEREGYEIAAEESDEKSGADIDRPGLWTAVGGLKRGWALIVYRFDRIARDGFITYDVWRRAFRVGAVLLSASGEGEINATLSPEERLKFGMMQLFATYEREVTAARTSAGMLIRQAAGEAMSNIPPFGSKVEAKKVERPDGRIIEKRFLIRDEHEQAVVEAVLSLHDTGLSYRKIVQRMKQEAYTGRPVTVSTVRNIIRRGDASR